MKVVVGLVGKIASGKTTVAQHLIEEHGAKVLRLSDTLSDCLDRLNLEKTRSNYQTLSEILRNSFGQDVISKSVKRDIEDMDAEIIIIEGVRRPSDIECLKEMYPESFFLINIEADAKLRYQRLSERNEKLDDSTKTWNDFLCDDNAESERAIGKIASTADFRIDNNDDTSYLYEKIKNIKKVIMFLQT